MDLFDRIKNETCTVVDTKCDLFLVFCLTTPSLLKVAVHQVERKEGACVECEKIRLWE